VIRLLLVCDDADEAWAPLAAALARQTRVQRVALVGAIGADTETQRHYGVEDRGAAWSWLRGAVPPAPAWGAPLLPTCAPASEAGEPRKPHAAHPPERFVPVWPVRELGGSPWEVPAEVLLASVRQPSYSGGGYRGEW
jgi:hypothetical protein